MSDFPLLAELPPKTEADQGSATFLASADWLLRAVIPLVLVANIAHLSISGEWTVASVILGLLLIVMLVSSLVSLRKWTKMSRTILIIGAFAILIVLFPFVVVGTNSNQSPAIELMTDTKGAAMISFGDDKYFLVSGECGYLLDKTTWEYSCIGKVGRVGIFTIEHRPNTFVYLRLSPFGEPSKELVLQAVR